MRAILAGLAAVVVAGCGPSEARKASVREALTKLAREVEDRSYTREVRRGQSILPGSFGEAFDARAAERATVQASRGIAEKCREPLARPGGADDPAKQSCIQDLEASRSAMEALLDLGRSERPGAPPSVHPFAPMNAPTDTHRSFSALCSRAAAEVDVELARGRAAAAALTCTRALEVTRDYMLGASFVGALVGASCVEALEGPCGRAIDAQEGDARAAVRADLEAVASSLPPPGDALDGEICSVHLLSCASILGPEDRSRLGPRARAIVDSAPTSGSLLERRQMAVWCVDGFDYMQLTAAAFRHPPGSAERSRLLAQRKSANALVTGIDYERYDGDIRQATARVQALARR